MHGFAPEKALTRWVINYISGISFVHTLCTDFLPEKIQSGRVVHLICWISVHRFAPGKGTKPVGITCHPAQIFGIYSVHRFATGKGEKLAGVAFNMPDMLCMN